MEKERKVPFCNIPGHGEHCSDHHETTKTVGEQGNDIAAFSGGMKVLKWMLAGIGGFIVLATGIGSTVMINKFNSISGAIEVNAKATETFVLASSTDRTQMRAKLEELSKDIDEIKFRLKMK